MDDQSRRKEDLHRLAMLRETEMVFRGMLSHQFGTGVGGTFVDPVRLRRPLGLPEDQDLEERLLAIERPDPTVIASQFQFDVDPASFNRQSVEMWSFLNDPDSTSAIQPTPLSDEIDPREQQAVQFDLRPERPGEPQSPIEGDRGSMLEFAARMADRTPELPESLRKRIQEQVEARDDRPQQFPDIRRIDNARVDPTSGWAAPQERVTHGLPFEHGATFQEGAQQSFSALDQSLLSAADSLDQTTMALIEFLSRIETTVRNLNERLDELTSELEMEGSDESFY